MFNTGQVNVVGFDPNHNCDASKRYGCKYNAKPEKHFYLDVGTAPEDAAKRFLQCRTVGLPLAINRLMGALVVRCTRAVANVVTQFVPSSNGPNETGFVGEMQRYAFKDGMPHI